MPGNHGTRASANTSCLIPIGVGRGIVRKIRKTFEKICKYWFKVVTVWRLIWGNDHLYCGFGARRSHLTLHWMSAQGSVGFRWGTITGPYHANFSQVETQKFDPHWFYCLQWGCNNLFLPRVYIYMYISTQSAFMCVFPFTVCLWKYRRSTNHHIFHTVYIYAKAYFLHSTGRVFCFQTCIYIYNMIRMLCVLWRNQSEVGHCSGSLEPESSCHDRDWIMELPMEADILTFTGILTPEDASVASCWPALTCAPRRSIVLQFFWSARKCL